MSKSGAYFIEWRSKTKCQAMVLDEPMGLPVEEGNPNTTGTSARFEAGDYMVKQDGRIFGRTKGDHEAAFEPTRKMKAKAAGKAKKVARKVTKAPSEPRSEHDLPVVGAPDDASFEARNG